MASCGFNPAPSCEGEPVAGQLKTQTRSVSILRPRARANHIRVLLNAPGLAFQSCALVRGRTPEIAIRRRRFGVSIRALVRGRTSTKHSIDSGIRFQSAPSCEGEHTMRSGAATDDGFNPRPRARANLSDGAIAAPIKLFQSAPSCEGERRGEPAACRSCPVSIRALVRGRTCDTADNAYGMMFQSCALVRGRTAFF